MKRYLSILFSLTGTLMKRYFRDRTAMFFTIFFPLVLLFVFGSIFRGSASPTFNIGIINHATTPFATQFVDQVTNTKGIKVHPVSGLDDAKTKVGRGEIDTILEVPSSFGTLNAKHKPSGDVIVYYKEGDPQSGQTFASIISGMLNGVNATLVNEKPPLGVSVQPTKATNLTQFDYTFSGLIGFSLLSLGVFGMVNTFIAEKKQGILRGLRTTPIRASEFLVAIGITRVLIAVIAIIAMLILATTLLNFHMTGDYVSFFIYAIFGAILMFGFGLAISGWAKSENQAAPVANLVTLPMMFLSGAFFPRFLMPDWLQHISNYIPLSPVIDGLRFIITENKTLLDLGPQLAVMGVWTIIIYAVAFKLFRWE